MVDLSKSIGSLISVWLIGLSWMNRILRVSLVSITSQVSTQTVTTLTCILLLNTSIECCSVSSIEMFTTLTLLLFFSRRKVPSKLRTVLESRELTDGGLIVFTSVQLNVREDRWTLANDTVNVNNLKAFQLSTSFELFCPPRVHVHWSLEGSLELFRTSSVHWCGCFPLASWRWKHRPLTCAFYWNKSWSKLEKAHFGHKISSLGRTSLREEKEQQKITFIAPNLIEKRECLPVGRVKRWLMKMMRMRMMKVMRFVSC